VETDVRSIWIDLDNSPHVPLFAPVIRHYREQGVEVVVTARDHSQTVQLLDLHGFAGTYTVIGCHYGGNKLAKAWGLIVRASKLVSFITNRKIRPSLAVSHGSRSMVVAARWLKMPILTMYDYEFTETKVFNTFSTKVMVPERIPDEVLNEISLPAAKRIKYQGIKEEVYVRRFTPDCDLRDELLPTTDDENRVLVTLRPPAMTANYHATKSGELLDIVLEFLLRTPEVFTVIVPRTADQAADIARRIAETGLPGHCRILDNAVNGLELAVASDLLISGGGTMNREAALLGVPVYSIFAGRQGALDRAMESEGLIIFIRDARDLSKVRLERRDRSKPMPVLTDRVERSVIEHIDRTLKEHSEKTEN
jgi:predicted glycosyltransferase